MEKTKIWLSPPHLCGKEEEYIQDAFKKNWITTIGDNVNGFEKDLEDFLVESGNNTTKKFAVALSSGTAAIHLALIQLGVGIGDEVLCQSFTFVASANPITYLGAKPVFIDSELDTWNISPIFLEQAIEDRIKVTGKKPKAIISVHLYGMPAKMDEIMAISKKYEIPVLEDAAESLGSEYCGKKCGTLGDLSIISFNGNKVITTSGGGMLLSKSQKQIEKARFLATQARDKESYYQHSEIGYNYAMSNICAGIGRGQMTVLPQRVEQRRKNNAYYRKHLSNIPGIAFQTEPNADFYSNYWLTSILVDPEKTNGVTREDLRLALEAANIESRPLWKPMHLQPVFADCPYYGDGTSEELFDKGLCLPSGSILTEEELEKVVRTIKFFRGKLKVESGKW